MVEFTINTTNHSQLINIDREVQRIVNESEVSNGIAHIFIPHTTAGVTINENADPDVVRDLIHIFDGVVPWEGGYAHGEGNSAAHAKASMMGFSQQVIIVNGQLHFGTWQSIYFCEFDGPRRRRVCVQIIPGI
jgi:secondary thiamine-phosphate synthase enzyme